MKLVPTVSPDVIKECRCFIGITDTKLIITVKRKMKFLRKYCNSENGQFVNCSQTLPVWNTKCWLYDEC